MPRKKEAEAVYKELLFDGQYKNFQEFMSVNKEILYKGIVDVYDGLKNKKNNDSLKLRVGAKIKGQDWDTKFEFKKQDSIVLTRDLIPYFLEIEDYETCDYINKLHKELTTLDN
jgi:hypothetical protein